MATTTISTTTIALARFSAGKMGRAGLATLALAGAVAVASPAAADPTGIALVVTFNRQSFQRGSHGLCPRRASHSARSSSDHCAELYGFMCAGNHYGRDRHRWDARWLAEGNWTCWKVEVTAATVAGGSARECRGTADVGGTKFWRPSAMTALYSLEPSGAQSPIVLKITEDGRKTHVHLLYRGNIELTLPRNARELNLPQYH